MFRTSNSRRRSAGPNWRLLAVAGLVVLGYFLFSLSDLVMSKHRLDERLTSLQSEVSSLEARSKDLEREVAWLQTDEALEALAREQLGWVKPGETGVVVMSPTPEAISSSVPSTKVRVSREPNWERWWHLFVGE